MIKTPAPPKERPKRRVLSDLKKRHAPKGISLFLSCMYVHACEIGRHGADEKKYPFEGGLFTYSSPLLKHHDRLTAEHSQRNRCPGARSFHGRLVCRAARARSRCPRCSRADGRAICTTALASELPFSEPFSAPSYLLQYSHATAAQTYCFCKTRPHSLCIRRRPCRCGSQTASTCSRSVCCKEADLASTTTLLA